MNEQISTIKSWLGTGSINIFGLPMSGKDTQGIMLAEALGAKFISSGAIIRTNEAATGRNLTADGQTTPTDIFYELVLPYFERQDLWNFPLVLSSIGRWSGEENQVMSVAEGAGHPIKAAISLNISEKSAMERWEAARILGDRGSRPDDMTPEIFQRRINEYKEKTLPVLKHYDELGLLIQIPAEAPRETVFSDLISRLSAFKTTGVTTP